MHAPLDLTGHDPRAIGAALAQLPPQALQLVLQAFLTHADSQLRQTAATVMAAAPAVIGEATGRAVMRGLHAMLTPKG